MHAMIKLVTHCRCSHSWLWQFHQWILSDSHSPLWRSVSHDRPHGYRCRVLENCSQVGVPMKKNWPVVGIAIAYTVRPEAERVLGVGIPEVKWTPHRNRTERTVKEMKLAILSEKFVIGEMSLLLWLSEWLENGISSPLYSQLHILFYNSELPTYI